MKNVIVCVMVLTTALLGKPVKAGETSSNSTEARLEKYASKLYKQIDFSKCAPLSYEVFDKAYHGYVNLQNAGKLGSYKDILSICDFTKSSNENRLWIIDLRTKKVLFNTYVAHGQGSGEECAQDFSNEENSHQSSLGFYVTGETYEGEHGTSLRLYGMDNGFNDAAFDRGIVVHGADYVSDKFIAGNDRLGRSWGCPAVPSQLSLPIINTIKNGTCMFIYYPDKKYLKSAFWMNKKPEFLPENVLAELNTPDTRLASSASAHNAKEPFQTGEIKIQYITNGKVDSVRSVHR